MNEGIVNGVMLNSYPDSIGEKLAGTVAMLQMPEFKDAFSLFYVLPTFFNSDLDRGFSIIDYDLNKELVSLEDLEALDKLDIKLKIDIVLNHLSVASPQFKDLLKHGNKSIYKEFFIHWNEFWKGNGSIGIDGVVLPNEEFISKLFMRKPGLPVLKVRFPDGSEMPYWNTFYQQVSYSKITPTDLEGIDEINVAHVCDKVNSAIKNNEDIKSLDFGKHTTEVLSILEQNRSYLGQMDVNGESQLVWEFYQETLKKVSGFGGQILRLDAFAYLHKEIGQSNFFNKPGTWDYLERIKAIATENNLLLLPEIHAEYGLHLHDEVADKGYYIYDFFLPGLCIHAIENGSSSALLKWAKEILSKGYQTVNMLGCHDGIPVLDLKGKKVNGTYNRGLLEDAEIERIMSTIMERGGRVKNLYDQAGNKVSYYQINATFYSALGEDDRKMLLARAIQVFMPGIPQMWYLDIFAGKNDYEAADKGGSSSHKEINRTNLTMAAIEEKLKTDVVKNQLEIIRLRNTSKAFSGQAIINERAENLIDILWQKNNHTAHLKANLQTFAFTIDYSEDGILKTLSYS